MLTERTQRTARDHRCRCEKPDRELAPRLHPDHFDAAAFCAMHFDPDRVPAEDLHLGRDSYDHVEMSVPLACALYLAVKGADSRRSLESARTACARLVEYHPNASIGTLSVLQLKSDLARIREEVVAAEDPRTVSSHTGDGAVANFIGAVRALFKTIESYCPGLANPAFALAKPVRKKRAEREVYSADQLEAIWLAAAKGNDAPQYLLILDIVRISAVRRMSVLGMNMEDINWCTGQTEIRGKGGRCYQATLSHEVMDRILRLYLARTGQVEDRLPDLVKSWALADYDATTGDGGTPALVTRQGNRISNRTIEQMLKDVNRELPPRVLRKRFILHSIRHTTLSQIHENYDEAAAAGFAGHWSKLDPQMESTRAYIQTRAQTNLAIAHKLFGRKHSFGPPAIAC